MIVVWKSVVSSSISQYTSLSVLLSKFAAGDGPATGTPPGAGPGGVPVACPDTGGTGRSSAYGGYGFQACGLSSGREVSSPPWPHTRHGTHLPLETGGFPRPGGEQHSGAQGLL